MPEYLSELLAELLPKLVDLASAAVNNPRLWAGAALAGFASLSLPFVRRMYGVNQREKTRRHIADHVASGRMSPESAVALLGEDARVGVAGEGFHAAAWTLGPVGAVILCAGIWLGVSVHPAFFALALGGTISLALSLSFGVVAAAKRKADEISATPSRELAPGPTESARSETSVAAARHQP